MSHTIRKLALAAASLPLVWIPTAASAQAAGGETAPAQAAPAQTPAAQTPPVQTPPVPAAPASNPVAEAFMSKLPATLGGTPRLPGEYEPGMPAMYFPKEMFKDPLVMAMATPWDKPSSWEETREVVRGSFHETGIRKVLREGTFAVPDKPGAKTFFGEYNTNMGLKQYWMFDHDGIRANLIVTIFRAGDRDRMRDEVAAKVFGGAKIADGPPAAAATQAPAPETQN